MMKKIRPELKSAASGRPGEGILILTGWDPSELAFGATAEVCVQRNQDHRYLGENSQWTTTQTWHQVQLSEQRIEDTVVLSVDARLVDPLIENPQMTYQLQVNFGVEKGMGVLRIRDGVMSSRAAGQSVDPIAYVASQTKVETTVVQPEIITQAPIVQEPSEKKKSSTGVIVGVIVLFAILLAAFFAWKFFDDASSNAVSTISSPATPVAPPEPAPAPAPEPAACSAEALSTTKDDLVYIQNCLKTNPNSDQVLSVIKAAKEAKRCDLVQRLFAFKGQSGDIKVALAYAREFDPATFVAGCLSAADKETAIYWYELVLSKDPENADAKVRLEALRK